jgi:hypothetical protein
LPVTQEVLAITHGPSEQLTPDLQATHFPLEHTRSVPQVVPSESGVSATHEGAPPVQSSRPRLQPSAVVQLAPGRHAPQAPLSQTPRLHNVPSGWFPTGAHWETPPLHEMAPRWHSAASQLSPPCGQLAGGLDGMVPGGVAEQAVTSGSARLPAEQR